MCLKESKEKQFLLFFFYRVAAFFFPAHHFASAASSIRLCEGFHMVGHDPNERQERCVMRDRSAV